MATKIKICGITRPEDARCAAECGADFIGLIFAPKSKRRVNVEQAKGIVASLPATVRKVGVFVNEGEAGILAAVEAFGLAEVQLHGDESVEFASGLAGRLARQRRDYYVWKSFSADDPSWPDHVEDWGFQAVGVLGFDLQVLLDSGGGGTGRTLDWTAAARSLAPIRNLHCGVILAGGLTPENVGEAIRIVRPDVVDVSSGVESAPGIKDHAKIAAFCEAVRQADAG